MIANVICFHGTTEENAKKILVEGFNIGSYFATHLETALAFGGENVFFVEFDKRKFNGPVDWQFHTRERVPPAKIQKLVRYTSKTIYPGIRPPSEAKQELSEAPIG